MASAGSHREGRASYTGCDIHLHVEIREEPKGPWRELSRMEFLAREAAKKMTGGTEQERIDAATSVILLDLASVRKQMRSREDVGQAGIDQPDWIKNYEREKYLEGWYRDRNYGVFARLADVRNGYPPPSPRTPASGVRDWIKPIDQPRGLPKDMSKTVAEALEGWGGDLHSTSWLYLDELEPWGRDQSYWSEYEKGLVRPLRSLELPGKAIRIVFGFDN